MVVLRHVNPEREAVDTTTLKCEMVRVHGKGLACVVAGFVRIFVVHIVRDADLRKDAWMVSHVVEAFFFHGCQLVSEAVPDGGFTDFDGEGGGEVAATEDT